MPAVAHIGSINIPHCSGHNMADGSGSVFVNGIGVSRVGDSTIVHQKPCPPPLQCCPHSSSVSSGSHNVFANGISLARVGDPHCTAIAQGSPNVFAN